MIGKKHIDSKGSTPPALPPCLPSGDRPAPRDRADQAGFRDGSLPPEGQR